MNALHLFIKYFPKKLNTQLFHNTIYVQYYVKSIINGDAYFIFQFYSLMEKPELYSKANGAVTVNRMVLSKYWNFVRWSNDFESVFEAGMGDGNVTRQVIIPLLPDNLKEYIASDISNKMLNFANTVIQNCKLTIIQLDICSEEIPLEYHSRFDKVFACFLLHMLSSNVK